MNCFYHPDQPRAAFCQECGKPLCAACTRPVGNATFCDACLQARVAPPFATPTAAYAPAPPPIADPGASPFIAGLLGFIPGVGAMYNGQFVKAMVHLLVFAFLIALSTHHGIAGILIAGWVFYQVFDAVHTARARLNGDPLPDPFGISRLEGQIGFNPRVNPQAPPPAAQPGTPYVPPAYTAGVPPIDPSPMDPPPPGMPPLGMPLEGMNYPDHKQLPTGAVVLIGAGVLFLLNSLNIFHIRVNILLPLLLIGLGIWLGARTGMALNASTDGIYRAYFIRKLMGPIMISLTGLMWLLEDLHIAPWSKTWPLYLVVAGVMLMAQRVAGNHAANPYGQPAEPTASADPTHTESNESALSHREPKDFESKDGE